MKTRSKKSRSLIITNTNLSFVAPNEVSGKFRVGQSQNPFQELRREDFMVLPARTSPYQESATTHTSNASLNRSKQAPNAPVYSLRTGRLSKQRFGKDIVHSTAHCHVL
jgi:hypothetical protein